MGPRRASRTSAQRATTLRERAAAADAAPFLIPSLGHIHPAPRLQTYLSCAFDAVSQLYRNKATQDPTARVGVFLVGTVRGYRVTCGAVTVGAASP